MSCSPEKLGWRKVRDAGQHAALEAPTAQNFVIGFPSAPTSVDGASPNTRLSG